MVEIRLAPPASLRIAATYYRVRDHQMAKECEFVVVDSTVEQGQDGEYLKKARQDNPGAILADSVKDMVDKILAKSDRDQCDCIKKLKIIGNGTIGEIHIGTGRKAPGPEKRINGNNTDMDGKNVGEDRKEWEATLAQLKPKFCKGAEVEILACLF